MYKEHTQDKISDTINQIQYHMLYNLPYVALVQLDHHFLKIPQQYPQKTLLPRKGSK